LGRLLLWQVSASLLTLWESETRRRTPPLQLSLKNTGVGPGDDEEAQDMDEADQGL
jgi:hypothetical protein